MRKLIISWMIVTLFTFVACSPSDLEAENTSTSNNTHVIISTAEPKSLESSNENISTEIKESKYRPN